MNGQTLLTLVFAAAVIGLLGGCRDSEPLTMAVCIDGWEIAQMREACLGPSDPDAQWTYDSEACRAVRIDLTCDDPSTGSVGVLVVEGKR